MQNARLDDLQAEIKIAGRNINSLRFRVVLSAYLRLLIFLLAILIPACASSSLAFLMMFSAYKFYKQGNNIQLEVLLFQFGTSLLFHVCMLLHLHTDFSGDRSGGLVFPSL